MVNSKNKSLFYKKNETNLTLQRDRALDATFYEAFLLREPIPYFLKYMPFRNTYSQHCTFQPRHLKHMLPT